jgi:transposase-like protein
MTMAKSETGVTQRTALSTPAKVRRPWRSAEEREQLLEEYRCSGQTVKSFCAQRALPESTFWYWRRRSEVGATKSVAAVPAETAASRFLAVPLIAAPARTQGGECEVLVGEMRVRLDGSAAQRVLDAIVARIAGAA